MACMDEISCLGEYCSCGDEITLNLAAEETFTAKMVAEFNGAHIRRSVEMTTGEKVVVPNIFNENYTHIITFFKPDGTQAFGTSFSVKTVYCIEDYTPPVVESEYDLSEYESTDYN